MRVTWVAKNKQFKHMKITTTKLLTDVMALARCVTAIDYRTANSGLQNFNNTNFPRGKWIKIISDDDSFEGYIQILPDGTSGRYSREMPDVNEKDIIVIKKNIDKDYAKKLIGELHHLLGVFYEKGKCKLAFTDDTIELVDPDKDLLKTLQSNLEFLNNVSEVEYVTNLMTNISKHILAKLSSGEAKSGEALLKLLKQEVDKIAQLRKMFAVNGITAAWYMYFEAICKNVYYYVLNNKNETMAVQALIKLLSYGCAPVIKDPLYLLENTVLRTVRFGFANLSEELANHYLEKGEDYIEQSLEAGTIELYNARLYNAVLFCFCSDRIFRSLIKGNNQDENVLARYKKAQKIADEKTVRIFSALNHTVLNHTNNRLNMHKQIVKALKQDEGSGAASQKVFELIEMYLYYPRYYDKILNES